MDFQCKEDDKEMHGGFSAGQAWFYPEDRDDKHINSWVTMFVVQTLVMYLNKDKIENFNFSDIV